MVTQKVKPDDRMRSNMH